MVVKYELGNAFYVPANRSSCSFDRIYLIIGYEVFSGMVVYKVTPYTLHLVDKKIVAHRSSPIGSYLSILEERLDDFEVVDFATYLN